MPSVLNQRIVDELTRRFTGVKSCVLVDFTGTKSSEASELRNQLRPARADVQVVKNTLMLRALERLELKDLSGLIDGPTAIVFGGDDPTVVPRILSSWTRQHANVKIRGGLLEGHVASAADIVAAAAIPPREVLLAQLIGSLSGPLAGFLYVLNGVVQQFLSVLEAIRTSKGEEQMSEAQPSGKVAEVLELIKRMTVMELAALKKAAEEAFGVTAAVPMAAVAGAAGGAAPAAAEQKTTFDVILTEIGAEKVQVIKVVRQFTTLGLKEAKALVESAPKPVKEGVDKDEADKIKKALEAAGAKVELK